MGSMVSTAGTVSPVRPVSMPSKWLTVVVGEACRGEHRHEDEDVEVHHGPRCGGEPRLEVLGDLSVVLAPRCVGAVQRAQTHEEGGVDRAW